MSSTLIPVLRYRDAPKAIDWLVEAFGLERHLVVDGDPGQIAHAQLTYGPGMLMLGSVRADDAEVATGAAERPTGFCVLVEDVDAHASRARSAGAEIVQAPQDEEYGGRSYRCRDLEGYEWYFTSYDPWTH